MMRWTLLIFFLLLAACSGPASPSSPPAPHQAVPEAKTPESQTQPERVSPPDSTPDTSRSGRPMEVKVEYNQAAQEELPGNGRVLVLHPVAHIHAEVTGTTLVKWVVGPVAPDPGGTIPPLAVFVPTLFDGKWILDWEDPPDRAVRLTLLAQTHDGAWVPVESALVRGDGGGGDRAGLLTEVPKDQPGLEQVVRQFHAYLRSGEKEKAWDLLHARVHRPNPSMAESDVRQQFLAHTPPALVQLGTFVGAQTWAGRRFPWCMCSLPVTEAVFRGQDGKLQRFYALPGEGERWQLIWVDHMP